MAGMGDVPPLQRGALEPVAAAEEDEEEEARAAAEQRHAAAAALSALLAGYRAAFPVTEMRAAHLARPSPEQVGGRGQPRAGLAAVRRP